MGRRSLFDGRLWLVISLLYQVRLIAYNKSISASPRHRVTASALTMAIQPDMILGCVTSVVVIEPARAQQVVYTKKISSLSEIKLPQKSASY